MLSEEGPTGRLPLNGLRVVDFGHIVAMPFASQWLAFMGAQVICIESRQRPVNRMRPPYADGNPGVNRSGAFNLLNMSKLSLTVNLREEAGRQIVQDLVRQSDVVTENFSTGTMEKLGLGYRELVRLRPDLVMLSVSAAGRTGPMKDFVGFHAAVLMLSGMASITGYSGGHPRGLGSYFPDPLSGMYGVYALLLALYHRRKTGEGGYIDVAMTEAMMSIMPEPIIDYTMNSQQPERAGNMDRIRAPHGVYPCEGVDAWVAISVGSEAEWRALCEVTQHPEWRDDPRFNDEDCRWLHQGELDPLIQLWTRERDPHEITRVLQDAGVPAGPSLNTLQLLDDPHLRERGFVVEVDHPEAGQRLVWGAPWQISDLPPADIRHAPLFGEHNHYILCDLLGLLPAQVEALSDQGVVA